MTRGIYQQGNWAILQKDDGSRMAVQRGEYEAGGYTPAFLNLETDIDFTSVQLATHATSKTNDELGEPPPPLTVVRH